MSQAKRAKLFGDANPLLVRYLKSGDIPAHYIPPEKRKEVSDYM